MHPTLCRLLWVGSFFGIVGVLALTGGKLGAPGFIVYEDPKDRFTIERPRAWREADRLLTNMLDIMAFRERSGKATFRIGKAEPPVAGSAQDVVAGSEGTPLERSNFALVASTWVPPITIGKPPPPPPSVAIQYPKTGKPEWSGLRTDFSEDILGIGNRHYVIIVLQADNGLWSIEASTPDSDWLEMRDDIEHMIATFHPGRGS